MVAKESTLLSKVFIPCLTFPFRGVLMAELVSITSKGRIVLTLKHGKHTYSELKFESGLSDRWLAIKLRELEDEGLVKKEGKWYGLKEELLVSPYELSSYMSFQAKRIGDKLAQLHFVRAIILFGGVAKKNAHEYSDLDMIIVVGEPVEKVREEVLSKISELELNYHLMVEPLILDERDFLDNVYSREGGIIYGVAEGFEVLLDKTEKITRTLRDRIEEIKRTHEYLEEGRIWLKVK